MRNCKLLAKSKQKTKVKDQINKQKEATSKSTALLDKIICRVCLDDKGEISLFNSVGADEKFKFCTLLTVKKNDGLPDKLCKECMSNMRTAYDFRSQAVFAEDYFRRTLLIPLAQEKELKEEQSDALELDESLKEIKNFLNNDLKTEDKTKAGHTSDDSFIEYFEDDFEANAGSSEKSEVNYDISFECCDQMEETEALELQENLQEIEILLQDNNPTVEETKVEPNNILADDMRDIPNLTDLQQSDDDDGFSSIFDMDTSCVSENKSQPSQVTVVEETSKSVALKIIEKVHKVKIARKIECNVCGGSFGHISSLKQHLIEHTGVRPFRCEYCGRTFSRSTLLNQHRRIHTGEKPYQCDECIRKFITKDAMVRHKKQIHIKGAPDYHCEICDKSLRTKAALSNHKRDEHSGKTQITSISSTQGDTKLFSYNYCEECHREFPSRADLKRHQKEHEILKCTACDKTFSKKYHLLEHMQLHENAETLLQEFINAIKEAAADSYAKKKYELFHKKDKKSYKCPRCEKRYTSLQLYRTHIQHNCSDVLFQCKHCSERFYKETLLELHMKRHKKHQE